MARDGQAAMRAVSRGELEPERTAGADIPRRSGGWQGPSGAQYALLDPRAAGRGTGPHFQGRHRGDRQTAGQMGESSVPRPANTCRCWEGSLVGAEDTGTP